MITARQRMGRTAGVVATLFGSNVCAQELGPNAPVAPATPPAHVALDQAAVGHTDLNPIPDPLLLTPAQTNAWFDRRGSAPWLMTTPLVFRTHAIPFMVEAVADGIVTGDPINAARLGSNVVPSSMWGLGVRAGAGVALGPLTLLASGTYEVWSVSAPPLSYPASATSVDVLVSARLYWLGGSRLQPFFGVEGGVRFWSVPFVVAADGGQDELIALAMPLGALRVGLRARLAAHFAIEGTFHAALIGNVQSAFRADLLSLGGTLGVSF